MKKDFFWTSISVIVSLLGTLSFISFILYKGLLYTAHYDAGKGIMHVLPWLPVAGIWFFAPLAIRMRFIKKQYVDYITRGPAPNGSARLGEKRNEF